MPDKAYAIFYDSHDHYFYFPIKRTGDYAGFPQFFGGSIEQNEKHIETISRELKEESQNKFTLKSSISNDNFDLLHEGEITLPNGNRMNLNFYIIIDDFNRPPNSEWQQPEDDAMISYIDLRNNDNNNDNNRKEMAYIVGIPAKSLESAGSIEIFLKTLHFSIEFVPAIASKEFSESETKKAFMEAFNWED